MKATKPADFLLRFWAMLRHSKRIFLVRSTPLPVKVVLALGLLYCISPWDLLPEWLPVLGVMDDLALAALLIGWANTFSLPDEDGEEPKASAQGRPDTDRRSF